MSSDLDGSGTGSDEPAGILNVGGTGGLTTALRVVPVLWYLPAALVMLRSRS